MGILLDTSVLIRLANRNDSQYTVAASAILALHKRNEVLHVAPQNLIEFRNVATRPVTLNGLGLSLPEAEAQAADFEKAFPLLEETPAIFPCWKSIVQSLGIFGKQVHDARLVAICHAHQVGQLLTFNVVHFQRMASLAPSLIVISPGAVS